MKLTAVWKVWGLGYRKAQAVLVKEPLFCYSLDARPSWALDLKSHVSVSLSAKGGSAISPSGLLRGLNKCYLYPARPVSQAACEALLQMGSDLIWFF